MAVFVCVRSHRQLNKMINLQTSVIVTKAALRGLLQTAEVVAEGEKMAVRSLAKDTSWVLKI
jgi:hypothetical protein